MASFSKLKEIRDKEPQICSKSRCNRKNWFPEKIQILIIFILFPEKAAILFS